MFPGHSVLVQTVPLSAECPPSSFVMFGCVEIRTSFSTCNVAKYYYSESSQLGDTTL